MQRVCRAASATTRGEAQAFLKVATKRIRETREWIVRNSPVPIGTVQIYQALECGDRSQLGA